MHILMTSLCKLSLNMQHWNDPKKERNSKKQDGNPGGIPSNVIWHPSNERDVVVLKSDLKWGDISHSKDYIPNGGNGSKRRWSSDLLTWYTLKVFSGILMKHAWWNWHAATGTAILHIGNRCFWLAHTVCKCLKWNLKNCLAQPWLSFGILQVLQWSNRVRFLLTDTEVCFKSFKSSLFSSFGKICLSFFKELFR